MKNILERYECVALDNRPFLLRPEQIFGYFFYVDKIWQEDIIRQYAKRLMPTECEEYIFVGSKATIWRDIFEIEDYEVAEDGFYREPRFKYDYATLEDLVRDMHWRCLVSHPLDIGYLFYDDEKNKERALDGFYHTFDEYYELLPDDYKPPYLGK